MAKKKESPQVTEWNYSPSPESTTHVKLEKRYALFINNEWVAPSSKAYFPTLNPANETVISEIAWANDKDVDKAVRAARKAYQEVWSKLSGADRGKYLFRIARMMQEKSRELAVIESMDCGKPIRESRDIDIPLACNHFFYYAGWADKLEYAFPTKTQNHWGWLVKSFRGIFRS